MKRLVYFCGLIVFVSSCKNDGAESILRKNGLTKSRYCYWLDTIERLPAYGLNEYLCEIETVAGIKSTADKGTSGIRYKNDSLFANDLKIYKEYFKCPCDDDDNLKVVDSSASNQRIPRLKND